MANVSELAAPGEADDALMAFQHRLCVSGEADRVPWPKPDGYDADDFLLLQRTLDASGGTADAFTRLPPPTCPASRRTSRSTACAVGSASHHRPADAEQVGVTAADWEKKPDRAAHTYFELGSFYYLAHDAKVPAATRAKVREYGLCRDEFAAFGHVPPQLYVRISNRLVGDFVLTQNNSPTRGRGRTASRSATGRSTST